MLNVSTKPVECIVISGFTATCLAALGRVRRTGTSVRVTPSDVIVACLSRACGVLEAWHDVAQRSETKNPP